MTITPKRQRAQLAKSELWMLLSATAGRWARELTGTEPGIMTPDQWPADDPHIDICRRYSLTPADLAHIAEKVADEVVGLALRAGYERAWIDTEPTRKD